MGILKIPRITTTQRNGITPEEGELVYDTTNGKIYKGNGSTAGGIEVGGGTTTGGGILHGDTGTTTDTYVSTITEATTYADGDAYLIKFINGNTSTNTTLQINSFGARKLYRNNDGQVIGGDISAGSEMLCIYDSTLNAGAGGFQCIGTSPNTLFAYVTNAEGTPITKGQPVYAFGGTGDRMSVKLAYNTGDSTSAQTVGLVYADIAIGQKGLIIIQGLLDGLSTLPDTTWDDGNPVYLGSTPGSITKNKPTAPNHTVYLGVVTTANNGGAGRMYVKIQNGYELEELHDVLITAPDAGHYLYYDETDPANPVWKNSASWQGNAIAVTKGGTGFISYTVGDLLYANGPTSLAKLAGVATNNALISGGVGAAPSWGKITEAHISLSDVTTNNATTASHGFLPKLNGLATNYLNGQGAWATGVASGVIATGSVRRLGIYTAPNTLSDATTSPNSVSISINSAIGIRNYTIPDVSTSTGTVSASFIMSEGTQTIVGPTSFTTGIVSATSTANTVGTSLNLRNLYNNSETRPYSNITVVNGPSGYVELTYSSTPALATATPIRLTVTTGTNLSTSSTYFVYSSTTTSCRLASSTDNAKTGTPITTATGSYIEGASTLTVLSSIGTGTRLNFELLNGAVGTGSTVTSSAIESFISDYSGTAAITGLRFLVYSSSTASTPISITPTGLTLSGTTHTVTGTVVGSTGTLALGVISTNISGTFAYPKVWANSDSQSTGNKILFWRNSTGALPANYNVDSGIGMSQSLPPASLVNNIGYQNVGAFGANYMNFFTGQVVGGVFMSGGFNFYLQTTNPTTNIGYGQGVSSPLLSVSRHVSANTSEETSFVLRSPRTISNNPVSGNQLVISNVTTTGANTLQISVNSVGALTLVNRVVTLANFLSTGGANSLNGISGRVTSIDTINNTFDLLIPTIPTYSYTNGVDNGVAYVVIPGYNSSGMNANFFYNTLSIYFDKDPDLYTYPSSTVGYPKLTKIVSFTRSPSSTTFPGASDIYYLLGDTQTATTNAPITERIVAFSHSTNIGIAEFVTTGGIINIGNGATASGTKTINIGTGGLSSSITSIILGSTAGTVSTTIRGSVIVGGAITNTLGFYGSAGIAQRAQAAQAAVVTTTPTLGAYGYTLAQATAIITLVNEIRETLRLLGLMKGSA